MRTELKTFSTRLRPKLTFATFSFKLLPSKNVTSLTKKSFLLLKRPSTKRVFNFLKIYNKKTSLITFSNPAFPLNNGVLLFSGSIKYINTPNLDLNYFIKVFSYNTFIVENIKELYDSYYFYCTSNFINVTDEGFSEFLQNVDKRGE